MSLSDMSVQSAVNTGLRERKKERTRQALIDAAFELFQRNGFDATTVEEIADAVEVSPRTFFRYFASKEEVALTLQDDMKTTIIAALAERPPDEPVMTAIRRAFHTVARVLQDDEGHSVLEKSGHIAQRFACFNQLMASSPALFAASLEHGAAKQDDIVGLIAARMGADPVTDLRPHLATAAATCAVRAAVETWSRAGGGAMSVPDRMDQAFGLLEETINYPAASREDAVNGATR
jgi:AcrR family transcriptional regulator